MWVRQWPHFWLELLLKLLGKIFLDCYFGHTWVAILRFTDRLDRIWLGVTKMWLLWKSNQTRKGDDRNAGESFRWTFLCPWRFEVLIYESVYIMERKCGFHPSLLFKFHFHYIQWWAMVCSCILYLEETPLQGSMCTGMASGCRNPKVGSEEEEPFRMKCNWKENHESSQLTYQLWHDRKLRTKSLVYLVIDD